MPKLITNLYGASAVNVADTGGHYTATDVEGALAEIVKHKYHEFRNGEYYYDNYTQGRYLRLFTEQAAYDVVRFQPITVPEYYDFGTLQWVDFSSQVGLIQTLLDGREETTASITHANRKFRFVVTKSTGWANNVLVVLQSVWSAITYPSITVTIENSTDAIAWTTVETCVFAAGTTQQDWGIHMKDSTNLHDGKIYSRITVDITDWTDNTTFTTAPLKRLMLLSNYAGANLQPWTWTYSKVVTFSATPKAPTVATGDSSTSLATTAFVNAEIINDAVIKTGAAMTGTLETTASYPVISKYTAKKSWVMHRSVGSHSFIFAPSATADAVDWDWTKEIDLRDDGSVSAISYASRVATGTAPLVVSSTTKVLNLNVDKWDDQDLPTIAGNGGKVLAVNTGATALEWVTGSTSSISTDSTITGAGTVGSPLSISAKVAELESFAIAMAIALG